VVDYKYSLTGNALPGVSTIPDQENVKIQAILLPLLIAFEGDTK
jgi:hypothetical protein